jgi:hypothetical protein
MNHKLKMNASKNVYGKVCCLTTLVHMELVSPSKQVWWKSGLVAGKWGRNRVEQLASAIGSRLNDKEYAGINN